MGLKSWINALLDSTVIYSFDRSGFKRHCGEKLQRIDLSQKHGMITVASSGIGLEVAKELLAEKMHCDLIGRDLKKLETSFVAEQNVTGKQFHQLDMGDLKKVYSFALNQVKTPIDLLVHNAGDMPNSLTINPDGFEQMFASQVLGPFILTMTLASLGKLQKGCRIVFVSSGGMYLQKLDLSDLTFQKHPYNKYKGYANSKRAQVTLSKLFSEKYPQYLFSAMHPGWADTPGVGLSMPEFKKHLKKRLRTPKEGADTILWLATKEKYPSGKFWFDRKEAKTTILNLNKTTKAAEQELWKYCESIFDSIKGLSL